MKNALLFKNVGLGEIGVQDKLTSDELYNRILDMIKNIKIYKESAANARKLVSTDSAKRIVDIVMLCGRQRE